MENYSIALPQDFSRNIFKFSTDQFIKVCYLALNIQFDDSVTASQQLNIPVVCRNASDLFQLCLNFSERDVLEGIISWEKADLISIFTVCLRGFISSKSIDSCSRLINSKIDLTETNPESDKGLRVDIALGHIQMFWKNNLVPNIDINLIALGYKLNQKVLINIHLLLSIYSQWLGKLSVENILEMAKGGKLLLEIYNYLIFIEVESGCLGVFNAIEPKVKENIRIFICILFYNQLNICLNYPPEKITIRPLAQLE